MLMTTSVAQTACTSAEESTVATISFPSNVTTINDVFVDSTGSTHAFAQASVYDVDGIALGCVPNLTYSTI